MRDLGPMQNPQAAFFLNSSLESLHVRMPRHCESSLAVATYLKNHPKIRFVSYPGLEGDPYYETAKKHMPNGTCGVVSFGFEGGRAAAETFEESLAVPNRHARGRCSYLLPASRKCNASPDERCRA